jgi:hypothetical protein
MQMIEDDAAIDTSFRSRRLHKLAQSVSRGSWACSIKGLSIKTPPFQFGEWQQAINHPESSFLMQIAVRAQLAP